MGTDHRYSKAPSSVSDNGLHIPTSEMLVNVPTCFSEGVVY